jgi:hypothetical protein
VSSDASAYCRDLDNRQRSWMGLEKDLPPEGTIGGLPATIHRTSDLIASFREDHSPAVGQPLDLGGEVIRDLHYDPSLRKMAADRLLRNAIHQDGAPPDLQRLGTSSNAL